MEVKMDGPNDLDQDLLNQFSCMGTTDRDELIKQFLSLVGNHTSPYAASFYLEMNNWNLHGAIGCYFDTNPNRPSVQLAESLKMSYVAPGERFTVCIKLMNSGLERWPSGCYLQMDDTKYLTPTLDCTPLHPIGPGSITEVPIEITAPNKQCVSFVNIKCFTGNGIHFGGVFPLVVSVGDASQNAMECTKRTSQLGDDDDGDDDNAMS